MKSVFGDFSCPQDKDEWEIISATGFTIASDPCCGNIEWIKESGNVLFTATDQINEEYPVYMANVGDNDAVFYKVAYFRTRRRPRVTKNM